MDRQKLACVMQCIANGSGMPTHWPDYNKVISSGEFRRAIEDVGKTIVAPTLILYESDSSHARDHHAYFLRPDGFTRISVPPVEFSDLDSRIERIPESQGFSELFRGVRDRTYANLRILARFPEAGVTIDGFVKCRGDRHIFAREILGQDRDWRYEPNVDELFGSR